MKSKSGACVMNVEKGIKWLASACQDGRFGTTQATVLALKAIIEYDKIRSSLSKDAELKVFINEKEVGKVEIKAKSQSSDPIELPSFADAIKQPGSYTLSIVATEGVTMPYSVSVFYNDRMPTTSPTCVLDLKTELVNSRVAEGEGTEIKVCLKNKSSEGKGMTLAIVGLPGGAEPRHEKLKEMVQGGVVDSYEVLGREVVLYWRQMAPEEEKNINVDIIARVPGEYTGPASRAYLYYTDEDKVWVEGLKMSISPKE